MRAISRGQEEIVECLIAAGVDLNLQNKAGVTALHIASRDDRGDIVQLILSNENIDPNLQDNVRIYAL